MHMFHPVVAIVASLVLIVVLSFAAADRPEVKPKAIEATTKPVVATLKAKASLTKLNTPHGRSIGKTMKLRGQANARWTVVSFWATWCGNCRKQTPTLVALHEKYAPLGVDFVGVNLDTDRSVMMQYIRDNKISWPQILTDRGWKSNIVKQYDLPSIPAIYLIGPDGTVVETGLRGFKDSDRRIAYHIDN